jgi:hypothetical protein
VGNILGINLAFARSSLCLVCFSSDGWDGPAPQAVDEEASSPLVDDACTLVDIDMTLSIMRLIRTSSTTFSVALNLFDIHTWGWKYSVLEGDLDTAIG